MGEERELVEDYCMRAERVHPWAGWAGREIKALKAENERLKDLAVTVKNENGRMRTILREFSDKAIHIIGNPDEAE